MVYLRSFRLPSLDTRERFINDVLRTYYTSFYPFDLFPLQEVPAFTFEPVTILCGGNGSGKSTLLNVIARKLGIEHSTLFNRTDFFDEYAKRCAAETMGDRQALVDARIITSDDVFDYLINVRCLNDNINLRREELLDEYRHLQKQGYTFRTMADYDQLKEFLDMKRSTKSAFVRKRVMNNTPEKSNGESALMYFTENIRENALYLLDEPENSLSAERQLELVRFISDSARFYGCQFIIASHSPFILSARGAKVYDLDAVPIAPCRWTELKNMRAYFDFFMDHREEFAD